jgi:hypothetical protein
VSDPDPGTDDAASLGALLRRVVARPDRHRSGSPMEQSVAALGVNVWALPLVLLGQLWVLLSAGLLLAQTWNTWLVRTGEFDRATGLFVGVLLLVIGVGASVLAVRMELWVFVSAPLAVWQFVSLVRVARASPG